jgi:hypothetical protein
VGLATADRAVAGAEACRQSMLVDVMTFPASAFRPFDLLEALV